MISLVRVCVGFELWEITGENASSYRGNVISKQQYMYE